MKMPDFDKFKLMCPCNKSNLNTCSFQPTYNKGTEYSLHRLCIAEFCPVYYWLSLFITMNKEN